MSTEVSKAKNKLVTMLACWTLQGRVEDLLAQLGVHDYSVSLVDVRGGGRGRKFGELESGNVKIEALVNAGMAANILHAIDDPGAGADLGVTAFVYDVQTAGFAGRSRAA
jgi:nitrogen regulatory protein P-II